MTEPEEPRQEVAVPVTDWAMEAAVSLGVSPAEMVLRCLAAGEALLRLENTKYVAFQPGHEASQD